MIEIVLAIGIAAFGIMAVVAMIPPALTANRDIAADAFVDEAVSKMKLLVNIFYLQDWDNMLKGESNPNSPTSEKIPNLNTLVKGNNVFDDTYPQEMRDWNIFSTTAANVFYLESSDSTIAAHVVIWKQPVSPLMKDGAGNWITPPYDYAARINIEISWPVNVVQANRQRRLITFDVYKK